MFSVLKKLEIDKKNGCHKKSPWKRSKAKQKKRMFLQQSVHICLFIAYSNSNEIYMVENSWFCPSSNATNSILLTLRFDCYFKIFASSFIRSVWFVYAYLSVTLCNWNMYINKLRTYRRHEILVWILSCSFHRLNKVPGLLKPRININKGKNFSETVFLYVLSLRECKTHIPDRSDMVEN